MTRILFAMLFAWPLLSGCSRPVPAGATAPTAPAAEPPELVENPAYRAWAGFKPGAAVTYRAMTGADGEPGVTVTTTTYRLVERREKLMQAVRDLKVS